MAFPPRPLVAVLSASLDPPIDHDVLPSDAYRIGQDVAGHDVARTFTGADTDGHVTSWRFAAAPVADGPTGGQLLDTLSIALLDAIRRIRPDGTVQIESVEVLSLDEVERRLTATRRPDVIDAPTFAGLLDVGKSRFYALAADDPDFPQPIARGVWLRAAAEHYARGRDPKPGRPRVAS